MTTKIAAKENLSIQTGSKSKGYTVVKQGKPIEKHPPERVYAGQPFGMSLGITLNMDNYESLRIDCWLSDKIGEDETPTNAFARLQKILDEVVEDVSREYR